MTTNDLFRDFAPVSAAEWKLRIQADLKGADYNEKMTSDTPEGIRIKPFYTAGDVPESDTAAPVLPGGWEPGMYLDAAEGGEPAARGQKALGGGVTHLVAPIREASGWLEATGAEPGSVWLEWPDIRLEPGDVLPGSFASESRIFPDPIGNLAATGNWAAGRAEDMKRLEALCRTFPERVSLAARADLYQQAGAHAVQQLAYAVSHMQEYLLASDKHPGLLPALERPVFRIAVGSDYFMEIAKIRALRRLWQLVAKAYNRSGECRVFAMPGLRNKTLYDYNTNLLRSSLECMAAAVGGADLICNQPYDGLYHKPNDFADRIGRNQLLVLRDEAHMARVANPADGSYYLESLTDQLGRKALALLKSLEKGGGLLAQLKSHKIQSKIREADQREQAAFESGELQLVGSNVFPNPDDRMEGEIEKELQPGRPVKTLIEPLPLRRLSARQELKRLRDEAK